MKKFHFLTLALTLLISVSTLSGCKSDKTTEVDDSTTKVMEAKSSELSDELAHRAYDAIFSLSFATLSAGAEDNGITVEEDGNNSTYTFENVSYLNDGSGATVSGYMKAMNGETTDESDVSFTFTGDPEGLKTVIIKSKGPHGETHNEGVMTINGEERPFMEFVDYFGAKLNQQSPLDAQETEE